jgi:putative nucleotide binding protein
MLSGRKIMEREGKKYEEYAYLLDELPHGRLGASRSVYQSRGIIQIIGETYFTILEAEPRKDATFSPMERVYVGREGRNKISHILGRIAYEELTATSKAELHGIIETIIKAAEKRYIAFFNDSQPITPRMHAMELIPGIGKKLMWQILEQRERQPFKSFEDLQKRVNITDPVKLLARRVMKELSEEEKYFLFTRPV